MTGELAAHSRRFARFLPITLARLVATMGTAWAAPGDLDTSLGAGGKVKVDFLGGSDGAFGAALQGDGKIVAVGWAEFAGGTSSSPLLVT